MEFLSENKVVECTPWESPEWADILAREELRLNLFIKEVL